jgi:DNA-directed RNA polymerase specialized sigma24 family protein
VLRKPQRDPVAITADPLIPQIEQRLREYMEQRLLRVEENLPTLIASAVILKVQEELPTLLMRLLENVLRDRTAMAGAALKKVDPVLRMYAEGLDASEIARKLSLSLGKVQQVLNQAVERSTGPGEFSV